MRISWNWMSEMVDLGAVGGPEGLGDLLTRRGLEVEAVERLDQGLEKVVTVQIMEKAPHPQADRLSLCQVTLGTGENLQIVCGAQNMKAGDKVALAQEGAILPNGLKIEKSKIRGVVSNGMLCSEEELGLKEASEGILILPKDTPLGKPLAEILGRNDTILTLKVTANRADCLSHFGIAREVAAALGVAAKLPESLSLPAPGICPISLRLEAGDDAPRFLGCFIEDVRIGPSPEWLVKRLDAIGSRSINNVVDATNLVLFELGHPVHAYDAEKIEGKTLGVRLAHKGEVLPLLDDTQVELDGSELVIFDGKRSVGLAGVMGGGNSEVQVSTRHVFLECAEFDPRRVRRASSRHQKKTEAAYRFERGIDSAGLQQVMARLAFLVTQLAGGKVKGIAQAQVAPPQARQVKVAPGYFAAFLGMDVSDQNAQEILERLGCQIRHEGGADKEWTVTVPSFRKDLSIPEDLAEEIARSLGYDQIRETVPALTSAPSAMTSAQGQPSAAFSLMSRAKDALVQLGLNETVNYSFTARSWLARFGMTSSVGVLNPLSEEHEALVPSLLPGLVKNAIDNWTHHFGSEKLALRLFELRPCFFSSGPIQATSETETGAVERWKVAMALSGPRWAGGLRNELGEVDFFDIKGIVEKFFENMGARGLRFGHGNTENAEALARRKLLHPGQSVEILAGKGDVIGAFGLMHPALARELKCRAPLWLLEMDWEPVAKLSRPAWAGAAFKPWAEFPSIERDFALLVRSDLPVERIIQVALKAGKPLAKIAKVFDIYRGAQVVEGMTSVAVRVIFYDDSRSLQESEAEAASAQIMSAWKKELGAELRS